MLRLLDSYPTRKHVASTPRLTLPSPLFADRVQLQQLVLNLVMNALEAVEPVSGRAKKVTVRSQGAEASVVIQIADNGIGLDQPEAAFELLDQKPEGMGLGLAIAGRSSRPMKGAVGRA